MLNKGLHQYRFKQNPMERAFAKAWEAQNNPETSLRHGRGTLDYMLAVNPNDPRDEVTDRDREVAATVVQWLGSPVGEGFVRDVFEGYSTQGVTHV